MDEMRRFRRAAGAWAAHRGDDGPAAEAARELAVTAGVRKVVLVEGESDLVAVEALARRRGRSLDEEGVAVLPLGGAMSIGRFLAVCGPDGLDVTVAGLCDAGEEHYFRSVLERTGPRPHLTHADMEQLGFYVCVADLEDELIRGLGADTVQEVLDVEGDLRSFRTFQKQPAQRERGVERQLRRFMGTHSGRKAQYARSLVERLDLDQVPRPLDRLLAHV
ncbi:TOPRIM nucleotidyl transferase/hydrolase domain-containing protein [Streptomyces sp. NPDC056982]|uniref:TOPRIM nucleotidyl transferase/hydrolase domain-containing protein n=1 Tax=Streptomyces sp. NPDC056982 TaxID=3345986 RepID=UPI0036404A25